MRKLKHINNRNLKELPVVLISAGHGDVLFGEYTTKGKQSPEWPNGVKIYEGSSVKDLAYNLVKEIRALDWPAMILNPELHDLDLHIKSARENSFYRQYNEKTYLLELHHNAEPTEDADYEDDYGLKGFGRLPGASGTEIWTSPGETKADPFVDGIFEYIEKHPEFFGKFRHHTKMKNRKDKEAYFHMLTQTSSPAAIFEWLFMTSYRDCCMISSSIIRNEMTRVLARAIVFSISKLENIN